MKQRLADNISLVAQTPGLDHGAVEIAVTVPTFRRPEHLLKTLESIRAQVTGRTFAIIVMENDAEDRDGAGAATPHFAAGKFDGLVVIAHDRGNCHAYNAGWFTAVTQFPNLKYVAVIDDDEIADPHWLHNLCALAEKHDCALVGGPQTPVFESGTNARWQAHPVFTPHYAETGPVAALYSSGNLLIRRDVLGAIEQPWLDPVFNFTGGGDADLIGRALDRGFTAAWCAEAPVFETVPRRRVTRDWITRRSLRNGALSAVIEHRRRAGQVFGALRTLAHSAVLLAAAPLRAGLILLRTGSPLSALYPVHIALGRVLSEFGYANEQYRHPEQN